MILLACPGITIFLVLVYILTIHQVKDIKPVLIFMLICSILMILALAGICFTESLRKISNHSPIFGYILIVFAVLLVLYIVAHRKYLMRGLELVNISANYIRNNKSIIFISLVLFTFWIALLVCEVLIITFIYAVDAGTNPSPQYTFPYDTQKSDSLLVNILLWVALAHYIWTNIIFYHCGKYVCRAASSNWIMHVPHNFKNGLFTLFKFHIGSVLLGSALVTFFSWISSFLYFIMPDAKDRACCCVWPRLGRFYRTKLFKNWLGFLNGLNYLMVSLDGLDFCSAGRKMTHFYIDNVNHVERACFMARLNLQMSKLLVVIGTTMCCHFLMQMSPEM